MANIRWVTTDCLGKRVELTEWTWHSHIEKRPFMEEYEQEIKETVCIRDSSNVYHCYRLGIMGGKWRQLYLHVIVQRRRGHRSKVKTFWPCKVPDPGEEIVCLRQKAQN